MEPVGVDNGACIGTGTTAFTIGARVLVGGVKPGRLRYIGSVHFVPDSSSVWCGIELDEGDGLHDGTVDNIRYFTCRQGHGIMAPRHRVTLNPATVHQSSRNDILPAKTGAAESSLSGLTLSPQHYRNITSGIPSPVQLRRKVPDVSYVSNQRAPSPINSLSQSHSAAESCRSFGDFRFRSAGAVTMSSPAKPTNAGIQTIRPLSASMTCEFDSRQQQQQQQLHSVSHRSSLTGSRPLSAIIQSTTGTRSSPKRVTFFDEVYLPSTTASRDSQQSEKSEAVLSVDNSRLKTSTEITNRRSRSADSGKNQGQRRSRDDLLTSQARAATIDEWRDSEVKHLQNRRRSAPYVGDSYDDEECLIAEIEIRTNSCKPGKAKLFRTDAEQMIDDAIADVPTPPETEMQLSNDSIESDYTWTNSIQDCVNRSSRSRPKHNREPNSVGKDSEVRDIKSFSDDRRRRHSDGAGILTELDITGGHMTSGDGKNTAGLELARTALAQYADLVRAAQECRFGHIIMTPPTSRKFPTVSSSLTQPTSAIAANKTSVLPTDPRNVSNNCDVETKPETSSQNTSEQRLKDARTSAASVDAVESVWESWSNSSCGGGGTEQAVSGIEDIEFETFDGEELLLDAAMIDSIDGESDVHSEDSMAMVPHLSDDSADSVELDGAEFTCGGVTDSDSRPASMFEDDLLDVAAVETQDFVDWQPSKPVAVTSVTLDNEGNETTALPSDDNVGWMNDVNDVISQQILQQPWTALESSGINSAVDSLTGNSDGEAMNERIERPMSLISSSSTDAGCFTYAGSESDMMISSGSAVMSSSVGQFTDEMDESWTTYNNDDGNAVCVGQGDVVSARSAAESNSTCGIVRVSGVDHAAAAAAAVDSNHRSKATDCRNSITAEHVIRSQNAEEQVSGSAIASASDTAIKQHGMLDSQKTAATAATATTVDDDDNNVGHNVDRSDRAGEVTTFGEMAASDKTVADDTSKSDGRRNADNEKVTTEGNDVESTTDYTQFSTSNCQSTNDTAVATDVMTSAIHEGGGHGNGAHAKDRITDEQNPQTSSVEKKLTKTSFELTACSALVAVDTFDCGQNRTSNSSESEQQLDSAAEILKTQSNCPMDSSGATEAKIPSATIERVQTADIVLPGEKIEYDSPKQQSADRAEAVATNDEQLATSAAPVSTSSTDRKSVIEEQQPDRGDRRSTKSEIETESKSPSSSTNPRARRSRGQDDVASSPTPADRRSQGHGTEPRRSSGVRETSSAKERASPNLSKTRGNGGVENRKAAATVQSENGDGGNESQSAIMTSSAESAGSGSTSVRRKLSVVERLASGTASSNAKRPDRKGSFTTSDTSQTRSNSARKNSTSTNAVGVTSAERSRKKSQSASSESSSAAKTSVSQPTDSTKSDLPKPEVQLSNETANIDGNAKEIRNQQATARVASSLNQLSTDSVGNTRTPGTDNEASSDQSSSNDCGASKSLHDTELKPTASLPTSDEEINDQATETVASVANSSNHNGRNNSSQNPDSSKSDFEPKSQSTVNQNSNEPQHLNMSPSLEGQSSPIVTDNDTLHSSAPSAMENEQIVNVNKLQTESEQSRANPAVKNDNDNGSKNPTVPSFKDKVIHKNPGNDDRSKKSAIEKLIDSRSSGSSRETGSNSSSATRITSSASSINESNSSKRVTTEKYRSSSKNPSKSDPLSSVGPTTEPKNTGSSKTTFSRNSKVPDKSKPVTATSARSSNETKANASTTVYSVGSTKSSKNQTNSKAITSTDRSENLSNPTGIKTAANLSATRTDRDNAERNSKPSIQASKTATAKAIDVTDGLAASKEKPKSSGNMGSAVRSTPKQSLAAAAACSGGDGDKQQLIDKASTSKQSANRRTVMTSSPQSKASDSSRRASTVAAISNKQASDSNGKRPQTAKVTVSLSDQLAEVKAVQAQSLQQIDTLTKEKDELLKSIEAMREEHRIEMENLSDKHRGEMTDMVQQHRKNLEAEVARVIDQHSHEINTLKDFNDRQLRELKAEHAAEVTSVNAAHKAEVDKLLAEHQAALDAQCASHEAQLQEITDKFEAIKQSLSEKVDQLRLKCDEMSKREQSHAAAGKKDSDRRNQLELEVNSLQVVVEKKNEEIRKLRQNIGDLEIKLEEVPTLKATISKQHQELENLQAIVSIKNDHERQLAEMHQQLLRRCERESKTVKRLSMNNEELMWRLSRSDIGPIPADDVNEDQEAASQSNTTGFDPRPSMSLMSKSCDSSHLTSTSGRGRASSAVTFSSRYLKTATKSAGSTKSSVEAPAGRLRRSGTYDAAEDDMGVAQVSKQPKTDSNKS